MKRASKEALFCLSKERKAKGKGISYRAKKCFFGDAKRWCNLEKQTIKKLRK